MFDTPDVHWVDAIGVLGCALYILNYSLLTLRRLYGDSLTYFAVNIGAASCVLLSLTQNFNLAALVIQSFWIAASLAAIAIRLRRRQQPAWDMDQRPAAVSRTT